MSTRSRRLLRIASSSALAMLTLVGLAPAGARVTVTEANTDPPTRVAGQPINRPSSTGPIVVAVALGASGTVASDALAHYEVFASSPRFSVYTVAETFDPATTQGGPAIAPTYTFADTESGRAPRPGVVVVPAVARPAGQQENALRGWIKDQADAGTSILGVCYGSGVLAATGLLDGRAATSHWSRLGALRKHYPAVHWIAGQRFAQDCLVTTTAGVTSGIPGALRVMADLAGLDEATRVSRLFHYPDWSLTGKTDIPSQSFDAGDLPIALNAVIPWGRPTIGIALDDGISEIDVASSFEVFDVSYAARPIPLSASGTVTTQHGIVLLTNRLSDNPAPTRLAVAGRGGTTDLDPALKAWAIAHQVPVDAVHGPGASPGFDGALEYLAAHAGPATTVSAAKMIDYPTAQLRLKGEAGVRVPLLLGLGVALVGAAAALPTLLRRVRGRKSPSTRAIGASCPPEALRQDAGSARMLARRGHP